MDNEEKIQINLQPNGGELIIRHGEAATVFDPLKVDLTGTITAPADFADVRVIAEKEAHVIANYTKRTIVLRTEEQDQFGYSVTGTLELHPELRTLNINKEKLFSQDELYDLLKFKGAWFKDRDEHAKLLGKLKDFAATVSTEIQNANDMKGSSAQKKIVQIKTNLDLNFRLVMPIFAGMEYNEFPVEICVDLVQGAIRFWLESVELHNDLVSATEEIFEKQLGRLAKFVIIRQY